MPGGNARLLAEAAATRRRCYAELRDDGATDWEAAAELGIDVLGKRPVYERWYQAGLAQAPREGTVTCSGMLDTGLTMRQLEYWTRTGYLRPLNPAPGTGVPREYPTAERDIARTMLRLIAAGLIPAAAHRYARAPATARALAPGVYLLLSPAGD
jgi:hypothetical protein